MASLRPSWTCCALIALALCSAVQAEEFTLTSKSPCGIGTHKFSGKGDREYVLSLADIELPAGCKESDIYFSQDLLTNKRCQTDAANGGAPAQSGTTPKECTNYYEKTVESCERDWGFIEDKTARKGSLTAAELKPLSGTGNAGFSLFEDVACTGFLTRPADGFYFIRSNCTGTVKVTTKIVESVGFKFDGCSDSFTDPGKDVVSFDDLTSAEKGTVVAVWVIVLVATLAPLLIAGVVLIICCCCATCPIASARKRAKDRKNATAAPYSSAMPEAVFKVVPQPSDYNTQQWDAEKAQPAQGPFPAQGQQQYTAYPAPQWQAPQSQYPAVAQPHPGQY